MFLRQLTTVQRYCRPLGRVQPPPRRALGMRTLYTNGSQAQQPQPQLQEQLTDEEYENAKPFESIPGPSRIGLIRDFLPGGILHGANFIDMYRILRKRYGDIFIIKGVFGRYDLVCTYNPKDFETVFRTEGLWPIRIGLESVAHYRRNKRPDIYMGITGLVTQQGKSWADMRNKVNPILMKVGTIRKALPEIDKIAMEFINRFDDLIDPQNGQFRTEFQEELKIWAFESVSYVALNARLNMISGQGNEDALKIVQCMTDFLQYTFDYDIAPSVWKFVELPGFKRLMRVHDDITAVTTKYVDAALERIQAEGKNEGNCVLEKLLLIDRKVAIVMAIDMLLGGIDTTTSTFVTTLYMLAKNPHKQEILRQELKKLLPKEDTPLTDENTRNLPYLRACMKEASRIQPVVAGNLRMAGRNLVISGYQVPKGTGVHMSNMELCNSDEYFPRSNEFLPERWLKTKTAECPVQGKTSNPFVYLPFGFGPRTCIGKRLAEMEIETLLARMLRQYRVTWDSREPMKYTSNLITTPSGEMPFKFERVKD